MSRYSGKCDLYDSVIGYYDIKDINLFISKGERLIPVKLEEPKDLIPFYPYVPYFIAGNKGKWTGYINESFIDTEERELLSTELKYLKREYRKAKRKNIEFNPDKNWYNNDLILRVKEQGEKATIDGIHRAMQNHFRKKLAEEMEKNGYKDIDIVRWVYPEKVYEDFDWHTDTY